MNVRVVERLLKRVGDELDGRMVGGHAIAHQTERHGQLLEQINAGAGAEAQPLAELLELAQEDVGRVDASRTGADYGDTKFSVLGFSHA